MTAAVWLPSVLDCLAWLVKVAAVMVAAGLAVFTVAMYRPGGACERLVLALLPCPDPEHADDYTAMWDGFIEGSKIGSDQ